MAILLPLPDQFFNDDGSVANGKQLFTYVAGSSTKTTTWTDATGGSANANPVVLDSDGRPPGGNGIWGITGVTYDLHLASSTDADPPTGTTIDYDGRVGVETPTSTQSEWIASGQDGTYISAISFSVVGDQTATYEVDRRLKIVDGAGTKYCTVVSATFGSVTTIVTKGDALAASITSVSYGLITATNDGISRKALTHTEGAAIASATTTDIGASTGDTVHITGTVTITGLGSAQRAGVVRRLVFDGALTLTHNASTLMLPAGANITTAAGDTCLAVSEDAAGAWRIHSYVPAAGLQSKLVNSAGLLAALSDETGTGLAVFGTSPAITTPTGIVKGDVGLGNVDNTADTAKPVSTAQQTALDLKAPLASPTFTGLVTTAGQIAFPSTANPSADANTLDDYEEGNWTPVLSDGSNNAVAYSIQTGTYKKVGKGVTIKGVVKTSDIGSVSGNVRVSGLPFTSSATANMNGNVYVGTAEGLAVTAGAAIAGLVGTGGTFFHIEIFDSTTGTSIMQHTEWTADGGIYFVGYYEI